MPRQSNKTKKIIEIPPDNTSQGIKNIHCTDHATLALEHMRTLFESKHFFDVVLIAGNDGQRVSAHRLVLSASSPYFSAMFTGSMREAKENEVTLNDVQGDILQTLVAFCYNGRMQLRQETVQLLLTTASLFQMNSVVDECTNYLADQLDPSNCLGFLFFAEQHNLKDLQKKSEDYIHQEFTQVCKNDEFLMLDATQLAAIIASDDLHVSSEEDVFHIVMDWVDFDVSEREKHIRKLLPLVRMTQLSPSFIFDHVVAVCSANDCQDLFADALKWHRLEMTTKYAKPRQEMTLSHTKPRNSSEALLAFGISDIQTEPINIECYCPRSDKWTVWNSELSFRDEFGVATMNDNLIIVGGQHKNRTLNTVVNLNLTMLMMSGIKPMNTPRFGLCVAVLENTLYAIGGSDDRQPLNSVERWDPVGRTWSYVAPMSNARHGAGAAVLNGCIYILGGFVQLEAHRSVECYNPRFNAWTMCAPMSVARFNVGVTVTASNGVLYAVGGSNYERGPMSTAECYDPVADKWTMIEPMSMARTNLCCAFLGKSLMAIGGFIKNRVDEYDTETKKWSEKKSLTKSYKRLAVCVVPNRCMLKLSDQLKEYS